MTGEANKLIALGAVMEKKYAPNDAKLLKLKAEISEIKTLLAKIERKYQDRDSGFIKSYLAYWGFLWHLQAAKENLQDALAGNLLVL